MRIDDTLLERMAQKRLMRLSGSLVEILKDEYPKQCRVLGDAGLKIFSDRCVLKAYGYGANNYGELRAYTFLAWVLGVGFDDDPLYPWVKEILIQEEPFENRTDEIADIVYSAYHFNTLEQLEEYRGALTRLLGLNFTEIKKFTSYVEIVELLERVYPQRVQLLGGVEKLKESLKLACYQKAIHYNINHPIGIFVYAGLVFFLGHKVDDDPLYAWAKKYLNSDEPQMAHKLDRLIRVIEKRVKNMIREIDTTLEEAL